MPLRRDRGQLQELQRLRASAAAGIVSSSGRGVVPTSRRAGGRALRTARHRVGPPPGPCHPVAACVRLPRVPGTDGARPRAGGRHVDAGRRASPSQAGHSDSAASARSQRLTESWTSHRILRSDGGRPRSPGRRRTPSRFGDVLRDDPPACRRPAPWGYVVSSFGRAFGDVRDRADRRENRRSVRPGFLRLPTSLRRRRPTAVSARWDGGHVSSSA